MTEKEIRADELDKCIAIVERAGKDNQNWDFQGAVETILNKLKKRRKRHD